MSKYSYFQSMLLSSANEKQEDGEGSTSGVDESIEVDLLASCVSSNSDASHEYIGSVTVLDSEARSDKNVKVDLTLDERDGVSVHPKKEETVVTVETAQNINNLAANIEGVNNLAAIIEDKKNGSIDEIRTLKNILNEQLRLVMANIEDLDLKNQNVDSSIKVNVQEINLHEQSFASTKIMMDALTVEMNKRNALLGKQSVQIALLTEQLQKSMDTNEELEAKFLSFVVGNKENVQQMSALEDELTDKMNMINEMSADIEHKNELLEEQSKEIALLQLSKAESVGLKTAVESLIASNSNSIEQIFVFEDDLGAIKTMLDEISVDIQNKSISLEEKTIENIGLTEQLQTKTVENADLVAEVQTLLTANMEKVLQISQLGDDLSAKTIVIDDMSADLTAKMTLIDEMSTDINQKNALLEEKSAEIADISYRLQISKKESEAKQIAIDEMSADMNENIASLKEKSAEIDILMERLRLSESECIDQRAEIEVLIANKTDIMQQMSVLEDDLTVKKVSIDEMSADINQKDALLDEKSAEIAVLSERLQVSMAEQFSLKTEVESDIMQQIAVLENETIALKDSIDHMSAEIRQKDYLLEEKSTENVNLSKLLQLSTFENDSLKAEVESLVVTIQEHASEIYMFKEHLAAKTLAIDEKIIENNDLTDRLNRSNAINESLEVENQVCVAVKKETDQQIAVLEDILTANKISLDQMGAVIQQKNALLEEKLAEIAVLSERLQVSMTNNYGLETEIKSLVASNKEHVDNIFTLNENLTTAKFRYDKINADAQSKIALLGDKSMELVDLMGRFKLSEAKCDEHKVEMERMVAINEENIGKISLLEDENAGLTDRLQRSKATNKGLEAEIRAYVTVKKETVQLIAALEDDLEAKKTVIDEMSTDIKQKSRLLDEKSAEIVDISHRLQISMAEKHGLKTEVESLVASNNEHVENISTLNEDLAAKMIVIDEMSENVKSKIALLEEKSVEIADLTKRLNLSKAESDERQREIDMKSAYINDITARLHAAMAESGELTATVESLIASNEEHVQKISINEDELATSKRAIVEMTADLYHKNELLEEKSLENDSMLKKLQVSKTEIDGLKSVVETLIASNKEMSTIVHVNCSKDLENIESTLKNMNEQNKTLQIQVKELSSINSATKEKNDELIREVHRLETLLADERSVHDTMKTTLDLAVSKVEDCAVNGSAQTTAKAEMLDASIGNSHTEDEAREDAQNKHVLLQGTNELFNDKIIGVEELVESQRDLIEQFHCSKEENDKLKSAMLDLVTSNEENAQVISMLGEDVAEKNFMIEKMNQDIVELSTKCANLTEQLQRSTAKNDELQAEVQSLVSNNKAAQLFKAKNDRLEGEVQTLVANNKENVKQILLLEEELAAAKTVMAESIAEINGQNELFEERSAEIAELTEELAVSSAKTIELEAETADLSERLEVAMTKIDWFEEYVESLVANSKDNTHQIYVLENQVTAKNITIDLMTADIDNLRSMYNEIVAEFNEVDEKFILASAERDGLKKSVHDLEKTKSKYAGKIVTLQRGVKDVIDANGKLKEAKKSMKLQNAELLGVVNRMTKSLDVERSEMEEMNKILESEKALTAAIISTMENERNGLMDQLQLIKTERDDFEVALQTLMASNTESLQQKTLIENDLAAKKIMIDEITASLEVKSAENTELSKQLQLLTAKHDLFKTEVRSLLARTKEELATKTIMIDKLTISLEEKSTENTELAEELKQFKVKTDVFKADVRTLVSLTKENVVQMSALEDELMVKKSMIGDISQEVKNLNMMCENMTAENTSLNEQVNLFKAECLGFKARIEDLESNITYYVKEVQNLALSLELAVNKVSTTDDELSQVTYSLYIERPNDNMQLYEMKKGLEHSVRKCEAKITEQKGTIDDLSKSLDSARVEIRNKNAVLEEKTGQIKEYLDVVDQVHLSDCGVGNFWTSAE